MELGKTIKSRKLPYLAKYNTLNRELWERGSPIFFLTLTHSDDYSKLSWRRYLMGHDSCGTLCENSLYYFGANLKIIIFHFAIFILIQINGWPKFTYRTACFQLNLFFFWSALDKITHPGQESRLCAFYAVLYFLLLVHCSILTHAQLLRHCHLKVFKINIKNKRGN